MKELSLGERWLYALKPGSWPKLGAPFAFGQALGVVTAERFDPWAFGFGGIFTLAYLGYIVLLNDWGDRELDALKRRMFPDGCSPKTIPDGVLSARAVLAGGLVCGSIGLGAVALGAASMERPLFFTGGVAALLIFQAYTFGPLRLNYRGGGEFLEMLGIGIAVPWLNAYAQSGEVWASAYGLIGGHAVLSMASALASGLSDEESDRAGGKRTFVTAFGNRSVRAWIRRLIPLSVMVWFCTALLESGGIGAVIAGGFVVGHYGQRAQDISPSAVTNAFSAQKRYKNELHKAIWYGTLVMSVALVGVRW